MKSRFIVLLPMMALFAPRPAIGQLEVSGAVSGVFVNPRPDTAAVSGIGTHDLRFGDASIANTGPNRFTFTPESFETVTGADFNLGTFTYFNGTIRQGTEINAVDLRILLSLEEPAIGVVTSDYTLGAMTIPDGSDPIAAADFVYLPSSFSPTTFILGGKEVTLQLVGFRNVEGDGFLTSTNTELHVLENHSARADLYARVIASPNAVPEPGTTALFVTCFLSGSIGLLKRRRVQR